MRREIRKNMPRLRQAERKVSKKLLDDDKTSTISHNSIKNKLKTTTMSKLDCNVVTDELEKIDGNDRNLWIAGGITLAGVIAVAKRKEIKTWAINMTRKIGTALKPMRAAAVLKTVAAKAKGLFGSALKTAGAITAWSSAKLADLFKKSRSAETAISKSTRSAAGSIANKPSVIRRVGGKLWRFLGRAAVPLTFVMLAYDAYRLFFDEDSEADIDTSGSGEMVVAVLEEHGAINEETLSFNNQQWLREGAAKFGSTSDAFGDDAHRMAALLYMIDNVQYFIDDEETRKKLGATIAAAGLCLLNNNIYTILANEHVDNTDLFGCPGLEEDIAAFAVIGQDIFSNLGPGFYTVEDMRDLQASSLEGGTKLLVDKLSDKSFLARVA